jgi:dienelactone hydrolase
MDRLRIAGGLCGVALATCSMLAQSGAKAPSAAGSNHAVTTDVVYGHKAGMALTLDVYRPRQGNGAAVISIVSGGWRSAWETLRQFRELPDGSLRLLTADEVRAQGGILPSHSYQTLLDKGFTVFAVRHGSSPNFAMADIVADLRRAVRFIRSQASKYGVDPDRIGIWGGSAGGHLALLMATSPEVSNDKATDAFERGPARLAAVVAYAPPTDFMSLSAEWKASNQTFPAVQQLDSAHLKMYSPITYVSADDPPTLIVHGDKDPTVPYTQGKSMHEALTRAGVTSRLVTIEGAQHGFFEGNATRANDEMVRWFEQYLARR